MIGCKSKTPPRLPGTRVPGGGTPASRRAPVVRPSRPGLRQRDLGVGQQRADPGVAGLVRVVLRALDGGCQRERHRRVSAVCSRLATRAWHCVIPTRAALCAAAALAATACAAAAAACAAAAGRVLGGHARHGARRRASRARPPPPPPPRPAARGAWPGPRRPTRRALGCLRRAARPWPAGGGPPRARPRRAAAAPSRRARRPHAARARCRCAASRATRTTTRAAAAAAAAAPAPPARGHQLAPQQLRQLGAVLHGRRRAPRAPARGTHRHPARPLAPRRRPAPAAAGAAAGGAAHRTRSVGSCQ